MIRVPLADIAKVCHRCGKVKETTRQRQFYTKNYQGPCGDSFCYASCELEACREVSMHVCDECRKKLGR